MWEAFEPKEALPLKRHEKETSILNDESDVMHERPQVG